MEYNKKEIKKGIELHTIQTNKFKTNLFAIFLTTALTRENVTKDTLISAILRRGTKNSPTQEKLSKELENMYGAIFDCGLDKTGDNHVLKFYIESVNDNFLPKSEENIFKQSLEKIIEIIFNPYIENDGFKKEYVEQEKNNIKRIIEGKIDNKASYALQRCVEEMYKNEPFGLYKYGYIEDLEKINEKNLYEYYKKLISECKIDIFVSGDINENIDQEVIDNENIKKLEQRDPQYVKTNIKKLNEKITKENVVTESMDVVQGKLVIGLDIEIEDEDLKYDALIYNSILGGTANSKLFQNVREKASLAYTASSSYLRHKNNIFINCGIEIKNYEKALDIIKQQIEDMKNGNFTQEEIDNAKKIVISTIETIKDEQDSQISYYFGQELSGNNISIEEYIKRIEKVKKEDIVNIANKVAINTIYFLKN